MTQPSISEFLKFANLQMASEALFGFDAIKANGSLIPGEISDNLDSQNLTMGNRHASKFTNIDAGNFSSEWLVVEHISNTSTGFSGTLFKSRSNPSEYVIGFRSTEFLDDAARDNQATNTLEIKEKGWSFGQIDDMESWYKHLTDDSVGDALLPSDARFSVTGYSLGGHLATAFNLLRREDGTQGRIDKVVTFNGAGVGKVTQGTLSGVMSGFHTLRTQPAQIDAAIQDTALRSLVQSIRATLSDTSDENAYIASVTQAQELVNALKTETHPTLTVQELMVWSALDRVLKVAREAIDAPKLSSGSQDPEVPPNPARIPLSQIEQVKLDYQLAVLLTSKKTAAIGLVDGAIQAITQSQIAADPMGNQFDVTGATLPSAVSNSQLHYGTPLGIFIEDQPLKRGDYISEAVARSLSYFDIKLLTQNYTINDFGDTHSLVLLVDSLNVQNTLLQMLPTVQQGSAGSTQNENKKWVGLFHSILGSASNKFAQSNGAQGKSEGDVLENTVNAMAALTLGPSNFQKLMGSEEGGTWSIVQDKNGHTGRESLSNTLAAIRGSTLFKAAQAGSLTLKLAETSSISASSARNDFGVFAALFGLSPFVLHGADPAAFEAAISEAWGPIYTQWKKDQSATEGGKAASLFTDEWMNQRAQLLERKNYFGTTNASYDSSSADAYGADKATLYDGEDIVWEDRSSALKIRRGGTTESTKYVTFNNDNGGQLNGGRREDYLFGGAGVDTLVGLGGNDYLQGNAGDDVLDGGTGNDMLQGGLGDDAYIFNGDWGVDEVIDSDGVGSIVVDGHTLVGGRFVSAGAWISEDGKWRYALNERGDLIISNAEKSGRIVIRNYADSQSKSTSLMKNAPADVLGLTLPDSGQPWVNTAGMYALQGDQFGGTDSSWRIQPDGSIPGAQADPDANNLFDGSSIYPDVVVRPVGGNLGADGVWQPVYANTQAVGYWGRGGNDFISGEQYEDYLDGGDGDDAIWGGAGSDIIYGGKGNDIIVTNMAATMPGGFGELPRGADEIKGPDNVVTQTSGSNITRWFVVRSTDGSRVRVERAHVKNPDGGEFYAPESASDQDFVDAGEGDDYVWGGRGADYLIGGAGDDHLAGLAGSDVILGGDGKDVIYGDEWVRMRLQAVSSSTNGDLYASLPYDDTLKSPALHGDDVIDGGAGDDEVWGDGGNDSIWGGGGNDLLLGDALIAQLPYENHGNDQLDGGDGNDVLMGMGKDDALRGGSGNDELWGDHSSLDAQYHGSDLLDGGEGDDKLFGQGGSDTLHAGSGNDWLAGEDELAVDATSALTGDDILYGGDGNDTVIGGNGNDQLFGDEGDDWLYGGAGNDALDGGSGLNSLEGGAGNDTYTSASATGTDVIVDSEGDETYQIDFRALSAGASVDIDDQDGIGRIVIDGVVIQGDNIKAVAETAWEAAGCLLTRSGGDLLIRAKGGSGRALVYDYFNKSSMLGLTLPAYVPPVDPGGPTNPGGNSPPVVEILLGSQNLIEGLEFSLLLPANTFSDPDGDSLVLNASLPDGSALPAWLTFDPATGKFTGTPPLGSSASLNVVLKATDSAGASVSQDFSIIIEKPAGQNITGTNNDDVLDGSSGDDAFHGLAGNDVLNGGGGNDIFDGGDGNDILNGGDGDNIFNGGSGNDIINPHASIGNSKFVFGIGDGNDVVNANLYNFKTNNIIEFKDGISPADVDVSMSGVYGESYNSLIFSVKGNDSIAFKGAFYSYEKDIGNPRNQFKFSDGTIWDLHTVLLMAARKKSTDGYDEILGTLGDDVLSGGGGYDVIRGYDGNDFLYGDEDSDDLWGGYGNDVLHGGADNDYLYGQDGDDKMYGGDGDDRLRDIQGSNIFDGGAGNDRLEGGGRSKDVFLFGRGDGVDTVIDGAVRLSEVKFKAGINPDDIEVTRGRTDLKLSIRGSDDQINLLHFFNDIDPSDIASPVKQIVFENGTIWGLSEIEVLAGVYTNQAPVIEKIKSMNLLNGDSLYWSPSQENVYDDGGVTSFTVEMEDGSPLPSWMSLDVDGTLSGNVVANTNQTMRLKITATDKEGLSTSEILVINLSKAGITKRGTAAADTITGQGFADKLYGRAGNDQLFGMAGPDQLYGEDGNDTLTGGVGNDQLYGGNGSDKYIFFSGDGEDLIVEESSGSSTTDIVQLKDIASTDAYLLGRVGDDLHITIGSDVIMIRDQFALEASVIEEFHFKDNVVLLATDIQSQLDSGIKNGVVQNLMSESEKFVDTAAPIPMPKPNPLITSFEVDGAIPMPKLNPTIISQDELVMPAPGPLMTYVDKNGEHTRVKPLLIGATEELINLMSQSTDDRISLLDSISLASLLSQRLPNASSENSSIDGLVQAISAFNADAGAISSAPSSFAQTIDSLNRQSLSLAMNAA